MVFAFASMVMIMTFAVYVDKCKSPKVTETRAGNTMYWAEEVYGATVVEVLTPTGTNFITQIVKVLDGDSIGGFGKYVAISSVGEKLAVGDTVQVARFTYKEELGTYQTVRVAQKKIKN